VGTWGFGREEVARNGVVAESDEGVPNHSGELAKDCNFQSH
jgi:hypothetical protein